jgi:hypothetical protein
MSHITLGGMFEAYHVRDLLYWECYNMGIIEGIMETASTGGGGAGESTQYMREKS